MGSVQTAVDAINAGHAQASTLATVLADTTHIASIQSAVDDILTDTADIQPNYAQASTVAGVAQASTLTTVLADTTHIASIQSAVDDILTDTADIQPNYAQASTVAGVAQASTLTTVLADTTHIASIQSAVDDILTDTADIQPNYAQASTVAGVAQASTVAGVAQASTLAVIQADTTITASIQTAVDAINAGHAQASALLTAAAVKVQVVSALDSDTYAEASGVPGATASLVDKLGFMATAMRNKIETTSVLITIYADDTSTTVVTSTISDDGTTFTRGEFA